MVSICFTSMIVPSFGQTARPTVRYYGDEPKKGVRVEP
jgi:hypothetical protein